MKIMRLSPYRSLFFVTTLTLLLPSLTLAKKAINALSPIELCQLQENPHETYVYCDGKMMEVITEVSKFDPDRNSPVWQLKKHIDEGYSISLQGAVVEALAHAEKIMIKTIAPDQMEEVNTVINDIVDQIADELLVDVMSIIANQEGEKSANRAFALPANFNAVLDQLINGQLAVDMGSAFEFQSNAAIAPANTPVIPVVARVEQQIIAAVADPVVELAVISVENNEQAIADEDDLTTRSKTISVKDKVKFKNDVKFEKHAEFKHFTVFHGNAKFRQDVTIDGTLSVNDEIVQCDLGVGCNIDMVNSIDAAHGNILKDGNSFINNFNGNTFVGINAGNFTTTGISNIGVGVNALTADTAGSNNVAVGDGALQANTTGGANVAIGSGALESNTIGSVNTANGVSALTSNTTGRANTAIGFLAMASNITGNANTAIGLVSMINNTTGNANTAVGLASLVSNTTGNANSAVGIRSLRANTTGNANVACGVGALSSNTTGSENTAVGANALNSSIIANRNIALGVDAGNAFILGDDNIYIANPGIAAESGVLRVGTLGTATAAFIQGIFSVTIGSGSVVEIDATGQLGTIVSSRKFKNNIEDMDIDSSDIYKLHPVTFAYNGDASNVKQYGLIAEEVAQVFPSLVVYDLDGNPCSVRYQVLPALLLNEMQKQHADIEELIARVACLEARA